MQNTQQTAREPAPVEQMLDLMSGLWVSRGIYVAAKLGIADHLREGGKTAAELAELTTANPDALYRILRMLAMVGVFDQESGGEERFSLTPLSETLLSDAPGSLRYGAIAEMGEVHYEAWGNIMSSVETGGIAFDNLFGQNIWEYFENDRPKADNFNRYMANSSIPVNAAISTGYDYSGARKLIDVGGGLGGMISAILRENPHLEGTLFDAPSVVEKSRLFLEEQGLAERCETIGGDFFEAVPAGGDIYTMRWIIHDWEDGKSIRILRNIRDVIPPDGRLLLAEAVVPAGTEPHFSKFFDLIMLTMTGGRERTEAEYEDLLGRAGFRLSRIIPTDSFLSIIEAVPA